MTGSAVPTPFDDTTVAVATAGLAEASSSTQAIPNLPEKAKSTFDPTYIKWIQEKYAGEREKRTRDDGIFQFVELKDDLENLAADPWDDGSVEGLRVNNGDSCPILIIGAGITGILFAVRLLQRGTNVDDLCIVDTASGFGGTWWYSRFPGLSCDIESLNYLPLLEEMDYMPKHKYSYGNEIRQYCESIAKRWGFYDRSIWRTRVTGMTWNPLERHWTVEISRKGQPLTMKSNFVMIASGLFGTPQVPRLKGLTQFKGDMFHTSRWDYNCTGGSPENPNLTRLKDKRVGIIGTGASGVQCVAELARWSKELIVFQRTPASVDYRNQQSIDSETWQREIATHAGWQRDRQENFHKFVCRADTKGDVDLVNDGWSHMPSISIFTGGPRKLSRPAEEENQELWELDLERQERIRKRVDDVVQNKETGDKLKAWYQGYCKRPCFHDEFLSSFNRPNVTLVDTGKGVEDFNSRAVVVAGQEYPVDVLVLATGFTSPVVSTFRRAGFTIIGKEEKNLDLDWKENGAHTLHASMTRGFPNLCLSGITQAGLSVNLAFTADQQARHCAYIVATCREKQAKRAGAATRIGVAAEPSEDAEKEWCGEILKTVHLAAPMAACTPGYINLEGSKIEDPEEMRKAATWANFGLGVEKYVEVLENWRADGRLKGLEITF